LDILINLDEFFLTKEFENRRHLLQLLNIQCLTSLCDYTLKLKFRKSRVWERERERERRNLSKKLYNHSQRLWNIL